jgi:hypothetical protein
MESLQFCIASATLDLSPIAATERTNICVTIEKEET